MDYAVNHKQYWYEYVKPRLRTPVFLQDPAEAGVIYHIAEILQNQFWSSPCLANNLCGWPPIHSHTRKSLIHLRSAHWRYEQDAAQSRARRGLCSHRTSPGSASFSAKITCKAASCTAYFSSDFRSLPSPSEQQLPSIGSTFDDLVLRRSIRSVNMLTSNHVLVVLSLLPLSLSIILQPVLASHLDSPRKPSSSSAYSQLHAVDQARWVPRKRADMGVKTKREPVIRVGGVGLEVHRQRRASRGEALEKRAGGNGSTTSLGTILEYVCSLWTTTSAGQDE